LSDIINDSIDSSKYYEHGDFKYLNISTSVDNSSIRAHGDVGNNTIFSEDINISEMHVNLNNNQHVVDIYIDTAYPDTIGKFNNIIIESSSTLENNNIS